jgi:glutamine amidotransferase
MAKKIIIIDYNMGNLTSVANALEYIGEKPIISNKIEDIKNADYIILPGVGAFSDGMKNLKELRIIDALNEEVIKKGKPFLGICLGMQLLAEEGYEGGLNKGLGYIKGIVKKFDFKDLRIPHVGWNEVHFKNKSLLSNNLKESEIFYFVHSYHLITNEDVTVGICDYGGKFVAAIQKENIFATQFHPEKSQKPGLQILKNFMEYKKC